MAAILEALNKLKVTHAVTAIYLYWNNRLPLVASASFDKTARLWNLVINLPVGPPLQHEEVLRSVALFPDGKMPVISYTNENAYTWDVHVIPNEAGLEDLFPVGTNLHTPRSSLSDKSFLEVLAVSMGSH